MRSTPCTTSSHGSLRPTSGSATTPLERHTEGQNRAGCDTDQRQSAAWSCAMLGGASLAGSAATERANVVTCARSTCAALGVQSGRSVAGDALRAAPASA